MLARALTACGFTAAYNAEVAGPYFAEAIDLARASDDRWRLSQILAWQASAAIAAGDPIAARAAAEEGRDLADAIGDGSNSRKCRVCLGIAQLCQGDLAGAVAQFARGGRRGRGRPRWDLEADSLAHQGIALAYQGETGAARAAADAAIEAAAELGGLAASIAYFALAIAALAAGDAATGAGRDRRRPGSTECPACDRGGPAPLHCAGRTGGRGSARGPPLGRRRGRDGDGLVA